MRQSWDAYFMQMAHLVGSRSTCDRKHVGCVLVRDKRVIATGYNGSMPGLPHCDDAGHEMENGGCIRTNHAEASAIAQASRFGIVTQGALAYCTMQPCYTCAKLIVMAGIAEVVFEEPYRIKRALGLFEEAKIKARRL